MSRKRGASFFFQAKEKDKPEEEAQKYTGTWERESEPLEKLLRVASEQSNSGTESDTPDPISIDVRPEYQKIGIKKKKSPRLSLKTKKRKKKYGSMSERHSSPTSFTQNYTEDGIEPPLNLLTPKKYSSLSRKPVQDAFPGIPLHIIQTDEEKSRRLKSMQKSIEEARNELEKLYASELAAKQRIAALQQREENLLKSCEKLEEMSAVSDVTTASHKKGKRSSSIQQDNVSPPPPSEHMMSVDLRDVQVCELLGTGASGATVYLVNVGGWCCAMKELPRNISNEMDSECFEKEMALLYQIPKHPNIARYLFHKKLRGRYCLFMSRYSGTLRGVIDKRKEIKDYFPLRSVIKLGHEVANGLTFLHSQNIIHRDIKSDNVFICVNRQGDIRDVALGDFDTSKRLGVSQRPKSSVGTPGFMAPEVLNACGKIAYSYSADVFSLGMVVYELMTLEYPYFDCQSPIAIASSILEGKEPTLTSEVEDLFAPILPLWRSCIAVDPFSRPTAAEVRDKLLEIRSEIDRDRYRRRSIKLKSSIVNIDSERSSPIQIDSEKRKLINSEDSDQMRSSSSENINEIECISE